ncbi:MAG: hypothetical protein NC489_40540 [Ruminococcus flavefaciens]|nr:hypothetical protein [Ruminococcus flavefaciens]
MKKSITGVSAVNMMSLRNTQQAAEIIFVNNDMVEFLHYREKLSLHDKDVYDRLRDGILSFHKKIDISVAGNHNYEKIYKYVLLDTPMIFHVDGCNVISMGKAVSILPKYVMPANSYKQYRDECMKEVQGIRRQMQEKSKWDTLFAIHSHIVSTVSYSKSSANQHDVTGPLLKKNGVCDGITKTIKYICDSISLPCVVIEGEARQADGNIGSHAWNAIMIDGSWHYYDFTFDLTLNQNNPCRSIICTDYFGLNYNQMSNDHFSWSTRLTVSSVNDDYFTKHNLVVTQKSELEKMIIRGLEKGIVDFAFRVADSWWGFVVDNVLRTIVDKAAGRHNKVYQYTYTFNYAQRTGYVCIK